VVAGHWLLTDITDKGGTLSGLDALDYSCGHRDVINEVPVSRPCHGAGSWCHRRASMAADRPSRPASCPHQMPAVTEARIVAMRRELRGGAVADRVGAGAGSSRTGR